MQPKRARRRSENAQPEAEITYRAMARRIITERLKRGRSSTGGMYRPLKSSRSMKCVSRPSVSVMRLNFEPCWGPEVASCARKVAALRVITRRGFVTPTFGLKPSGKISMVCEATEGTKGAALWLLNHFVRLHSGTCEAQLGKWSGSGKRRVGRFASGRVCRTQYKLLSPFSPGSAVETKDSGSEVNVQAARHHGQ